jgi:hypothetical protein
MGENLPKVHNIYQVAFIAIPNGCKIFQMAKKYTNIVYSKALPNIQK